MAIKKYVKYSIIAAVLMLLFFASTASSVSAYEGCRAASSGVEYNYTDGDFEHWRFNNTTELVTCSNMMINISGNLTIENGSSVIFSNVTLLFNDSINMANHNLTLINITNGSFFGINDSSNITVYSDGVAGRNNAINNVSYSIYTSNNSTFYVNDSTISYLANETIGATVHGFFTRGFVELYNSTLRNTMGYALRVNGTTTGTKWPNGGFRMTYVTLVNAYKGVSLYNVSVIDTIYNSNLSETSKPINLEANGTSVVVNNTTIDAQSVFSSTIDYINITWPTVFRVRNAYWLGQSSATAPPVSGSYVNVTSSENSTFVNTSITSVSTGLTALRYFDSYNIHSAATYTFGNYSVNVSSPSVTGNYSDNLTTVAHYFAINSSSDGENVIDLTVYDHFNNVTITPVVTSTTVSAGFSTNVTFVLNNTGNGGDIINWTIFSLSDNTSGSWSVSFTNNSINLTNETQQTVRLRVNAPGSAVPNSSYLINITVNATATGIRNGVTRIDSFNLTVYVNNSINGIDIGKSVWNATQFLELNFSNAGGTYGSWNDSNYSTAWALWAYGNTPGVNTTLFNNSTTWLNTTQNALGYWSDNLYGNNTTTAMLILAMKNYGLDDNKTALDDKYPNITLAINYLEDISHNTIISGAGWYCWPNTTTCDAYNTSVILSGLLSTVERNTSIVKNATAWLLENQSTDGSWNNNLTHTAWALYALASNPWSNSFTSNGKTYNMVYNLSNASRWLQNQQEIEGYFDRDAHVLDTSLAILALDKYNSRTWTVDVDQNTSTTSDRYPGSIKNAIEWILTKQESYGAGGAGGWGTSPANALASGMAVLGVGQWGTINGTITGAGPSINYILRNTTVTLGSYSTVVNNDGAYTLNAPVGSYALTTTHTDFETNDTNTSVTIGNGANVSQDLTMLPSIQIVPERYTGIFSDDVGDTWAANEPYVLNATVQYIHNLTQNVSGTYTLTNNRDASGFTIVATSFNNYTIATGKNAPSTSANSYIITLTATDSYGTIATYETTVSVAGSGSSPSPTPIAGSPSSSSSQSDYSMSVTSYDSQVSVIQGESSSTEFTIKNNGLKLLDDVRLVIIGIPSAWYKITVKGSDATTEDLTSGESVTFDIEFTPPDDADPKAYTITMKAKDADGRSIAEKKVTFKVTKVWDTVKIADLKGDIEVAKGELADVKAEIQVLKAKGVDTAEMQTDIDALNTLLQEAITKYNAGEYTEAERKYKEALELVEKIRNSAAAASPGIGLLSNLFSRISLGLVSIVLIVVLVGGFVGFIIWYKMFRVVPVSEIKKDPKLFSEGARIEGVVKSITETKKGKVFLVQDHTNRMHVRYPYYTTIEKGYLIRAVGVVKTYKDVPYMDASDIHRVTVKHFGGFMKGSSKVRSKPASNFLKRFKKKK